VGGSVADAQRLREKYGLLRLCHHNPPMGLIHDAAAVETCLQFIEAVAPFRFCLLAVGSPQQEMLARALLVRGKAKGLALCIGASINFLTGSEKRAPRWMQTVGLEWLYRLKQDPRRLAKRYLVRGPRIFCLLPRIRIERRSSQTIQSVIPRT
jgi:exopolysaccharide biosynthesis WecB/TagA/CpsF family protein